MTDIASIEPGTAAHDGLRLAGLALGQAAWSLEDGPELVPIGLSRDGDQIASDRFVIALTDEAFPRLWSIVADKVAEGEYGVLAFESAAPGADFRIIHMQLIDHKGELVGTVRQAYRAAGKSRILGRPHPFEILGTPVPSDEIDVDGTREAILLGVMSHPEGERLFPQLAGFAREMIAAANAPATE